MLGLVGIFCLRKGYYFGFANFFHLVTFFYLVTFYSLASFFSLSAFFNLSLFFSFASFKIFTACWGVVFRIGGKIGRFGGEKMGGVI